MRLRDWAMLRGIPLDVQHLNCADQGLTSLEGIAGFRQVTWINCAGNRLRQLPDLHALAYLNTLDASRNKLEFMGTIPRTLTHVNLHRNALSELNFIGACTQLQFLNASINLLEKVDDLSQTSLLYLDLRSNRLRKKPLVPAFTQHVLLEGNPLDEEEEITEDEKIADS